MRYVIQKLTKSRDEIQSLLNLIQLIDIGLKSSKQDLPNNDVDLQDFKLKRLGLSL
jgi:hypothetical protein